MQTKSKEIIATADGSPSIYVPELKETYHSRHGAQTESTYVFIEKGLQYWQEKNPNTDPVRILEVGFGTGLNAFLTYAYAQENQKPIFYETLEKFPLDINLLQAMDFDAFFGSEVSQQYFWPLHQSAWQATSKLDSFFEFSKREDDFLNYSSSQTFDLIFYDAFGAHAQPDLWTEEAMSKAASLLRPDGVWVSYCAKGSVRRALEASGLVAERLPGPPGKREMLRATKP